jgi:hypothetical protein
MAGRQRNIQLATEIGAERSGALRAGLSHRSELGIRFPNLGFDQTTLTVGRSRCEPGLKLLALRVAMSSSFYFAISFSHWSPPALD